MRALMALGPDVNLAKQIQKPGSPPLSRVTTESRVSISLSSCNVATRRSTSRES